MGTPLQKLLFIASLIFLSGSCGDKKNKTNVLAELVELISGQAETRTTAQKGWSIASPGAQFISGDVLRTNEDGVARIQFVGEFLRMGPNTTVFFGKKELDFDGEIEVGPAFVDFGIDFGDVEITTTGRLKLIKKDSTLGFQVLVGQATIVENGEKSSLGEGEELYFELGQGSIEKITTDAGIVPPPDAAAAGEITNIVSALIKGKNTKIRTKDSDWQALKAGLHELGTGTEISVQKGSRVTLSRDTKKIILSGPSQALIESDVSKFVRLRKGRLEAQTTQKAITIAVPGGTIELVPDGEQGTASIGIDKKGVLTKVKAGHAILRIGNKKEKVRIGESALIGHGNIDFVVKEPSYAHITLTVGATSNITLHTPKTPTNVRINFKNHCPRAQLEVARGGSYRRPTQERIGKKSVILSLNSGRHWYRVRCYQGNTLAKKPSVLGRIQIIRDSGSRSLARKAPHNRIDADGRRYTVLFQNKLPALRLSWPSAPHSGQYRLLIRTQKSGKTKEWKTQKPIKEFKSGIFKEGNYEYWFSSDSEESKHSHFKISFDNAAAKGYLSHPKANMPIKGAQVQVTGAAVQGWRVFVEQQELSLDKQHRFDESVPVNKDGIAVRFVHPKYGTHYYLRAR